MCFQDGALACLLAGGLCSLLSPHETAANFFQNNKSKRKSKEKDIMPCVTKFPKSHTYNSIIFFFVRSKSSPVTLTGDWGGDWAPPLDGRNVK